MNIGVVGYGVVGQAITEGFREHGHMVFTNDLPSSNHTCYPKEVLMNDCDLIFICVPTPTLPSGMIDLTAINQVARDFFELSASQSPNKTVPPLVIKSTVLPGTCQRLNCQYAPLLRFSSNPEFMTANNALQDFLEPDRTIVGTDFPEMEKLFMELYKDFPGHLLMMSSTAAELAKYMSNIFLVHKVAFALTMGKCADLYRVNSDLLFYAVGSDKRIGPSHLNPKKGKIPRDSPCLPKDLQAFLTEMKKVCGQLGSHRSMEEVVELLKVIQKIGIEQDECLSSNKS